MHCLKYQKRGHDSHLPESPLHLNRARWIITTCSIALNGSSRQNHPTHPLDPSSTGLAVACTAVVEHIVADMALRTPASAARHTGIAAAEAPAHIPPAWHSRQRIRVNASMRACMLALMSLVRCAHAFTPHTHTKVDLLRLVVRILLLLLGILILQTFACRRSICQYSSSKHALKV